MKEDPGLPGAEPTALVVASSNFESRSVHIINDETLRIKPTVASLAFSFVFVLLGLGLAVLWGLSTFTDFDGPGSVPLLLIGVLFAAAGLGSYYSSNEQLVINREAGVAFIRSWRPSASPDTSLMSKHIKVADISAIQTISRTVKHRSSKRRNSYTEYQVNVCVGDEERHNVFITLKQEKAEELGRRLSTLFGVSLFVH